jgi:hypothetical protein
MNALSLTSRHGQRLQQSLVILETTTRSLARGLTVIVRHYFMNRCLLILAAGEKVRSICVREL